MKSSKKVQLIGGLVAAACLMVGIYYISFLIVSPFENNVEVRKKSDMCVAPIRVASVYTDFAKFDNWKEAQHRLWPLPGALKIGENRDWAVYGEDGVTVIATTRLSGAETERVMKLITLAYNVGFETGLIRGKNALAGKNQNFTEVQTSQGSESGAGASGTFGQKLTASESRWICADVSWSDTRSLEDTKKGIPIMEISVDADENKISEMTSTLSRVQQDLENDIGSKKRLIKYFGIKDGIANSKIGKVSILKPVSLWVDNARAFGINDGRNKYMDNREWYMAKNYN